MHFFPIVLFGIFFRVSVINGPCFNVLQKNIPDISQKMLTVTLRALEEDGLVKRVIYAEVPPRVEYSLTDRAKSLLPCIDSLIAWAGENMAAILSDRMRSKVG